MKKNNQLNLYFEDRVDSKKNSNDGRINLVLSCILLFSCIILSLLHQSLGYCEVVILI